MHALHRASFLISETRPATKIGFFGKILDSRARTISNDAGIPIATIRLWLLAAGRGKLHPKDMARMLGRLQWISWPVGASSPFLAGANAARHACSGVFTRAVARAMATFILFAFPKHTVHTNPISRHVTIFADATPCGSRFCVGVVGRRGLYKHELCPSGIVSLHQAKLYAAFFAVKLAAYSQEPAICLGLDNYADRAQIGFMRSATRCPVRQRILQKLSWLRAWASIDIACFRVVSAVNPADSLSRVHKFPSRRRAIADAEFR